MFISYMLVGSIQPMEKGLYQLVLKYKSKGEHLLRSE